MGSAHRILLVDDDPDIRETLSEFLSDEGYDVASAGNGREALQALRGAPPPCVILLDLSMPVMDGFEFRAEQLKDAAIAGIPVVVVTAGRQTLGFGPEVPVVRKPPDLDELLETIGASCASLH